MIPTTDGPSLVDLMRMSEGEWDAYTRGSGMRRVAYSGLRRNAAIAIGSWLAGCEAPDPEAVGELVAAAGLQRRSEVHEFGLFSHAEMEAAFSDAGLTVERRPEALRTRGLYVARVRPA